MQAQELDREIWLRAGPASASVARAFAGEAARDLGCDRAATEAFRLGITEAVANAVEMERGRGLPLMFAVMDHVEIDGVPGHTVVRLAKRLAA